MGTGRSGREKGSRLPIAAAEQDPGVPIGSFALRSACRDPGPEFIAEP